MQVTHPLGLIPRGCLVLSAVVLTGPQSNKRGTFVTLGDRPGPTQWPGSEWMVKGNRSGRIVVVDDRVDLPATPAKTLAASKGEAGASCSGGAPRPALLGCWTIALPQEVPPAGASFRSESLSMPEKVSTPSSLGALTMYGEGLATC